MPLFSNSPSTFVAVAKPRCGRLKPETSQTGRVPLPKEIALVAGFIMEEETIRKLVQSVG
jgi:hypothetical protein